MFPIHRLSVAFAHPFCKVSGGFLDFIFMFL
jgi:hypothetical protein